MNIQAVAGILGAVAMSFASRSIATDYEYGVTIGYGRSDNIARVRTDPQSENIATAGLDFRLLREEGRLTADIDVDLAYYDYQDETFESEVLGIANADIRLDLVPDRFSWIVLENFGQNELNPFLAASPDNRENINYFSTGPEFAARLGTVGELTLYSRYSITDFGESNFDDTRLLTGAAISRELSGQSLVSFNAMTERVEFDDVEFGSDYDRNSAYVGYEVEGARTRLATDIGYSVIHDREDTDGSPLIDVSVERDLSESSTVSLRGGVRSSDNSTSLRDGTTPGGGIPDGPDQASTSVPFELRHATLGWDFIAQRTQFVLLGGYEEEIYEQGVDLGREHVYVRASAERQLTPRVGLRAQVMLFETDFESNAQSDDETRYGLFLTWNPAGHLFFEADVERLDRESTDVDTEFDETRYFIRLAWRGSNRSTGAR
jgi:hypothetical protein